MIRSMTGFGAASDQVDGIHYVVEIRSLNNRYFKALIKLPEEIGSLEAEVEAQLRKRLFRGSISLAVRMKLSDHRAVHRINEAALAAYLESITALRARLDAGGGDTPVDVVGLLGLPGVLQQAQDDDVLIAASGPVVLRLACEACESLIAMRVTEGAALREDIHGQCAVICDHLEGIGERAPCVLEEYHQRLRQRMESLAQRAELNMAEQDLVREVAIFAERADISEETSRLGGHLDHAAKILSTGNAKPSGRTLDFLAQEMLREANTIASKSNDGQISRAIVEVKGAIDRIKEQVQNIE